MGVFRLYLELLEGLKIVKKGTDINTDISNKIGRFQNKDVIKTNHTYDNRKDSNIPRNDGISNKEFIDILKKASDGKKLINSYYNIQFKNSNNKYDDLIFYVDDRSIRLITVIQHNRDKPTYKAKDSDISIILQSVYPGIIFI